MEFAGVASRPSGARCGATAAKVAATSPDDKAAQKEQLATLDAQIATEQVEYDRLAAEILALQTRRDSANALLSRCRDFLIERGVS